MSSTPKPDMIASDATLAPLAPLAVNIRIAADLIGVGQRTIESLIAAGELAAPKVGTRRLVLVDELRRWLNRKASETPRPSSLAMANRAERLAKRFEELAKLAVNYWTDDAVGEAFEEAHIEGGLIFRDAWRRGLLDVECGSREWLDGYFRDEDHANALFPVERVRQIYFEQCLRMMENATKPLCIRVGEYELDVMDSGLPRRSLINPQVVAKNDAAAFHYIADCLREGPACVNAVATTTADVPLDPVEEARQREIAAEKRAGQRKRSRAAAMEILAKRERAFQERYPDGYPGVVDASVTPLIDVNADKVEEEEHLRKVDFKKLLANFSGDPPHASTLCKWAKDPTFPKPAGKRGRSTLYNKSEVLAWASENTGYWPSADIFPDETISERNS